MRRRRVLPLWLLCAALAAPLSGAHPDAEVFERMYREVLGFEGGYTRLDPVAGLLHSADYRRKVPWPEHPAGSFEFKTNNLGFREDLSTSVKKAPGVWRVLVAGDSHTDGLVDNAETFPNLAEADLAGRYGAGAFEVINGGVTHTGFRDYLGFLKRHRRLKPDVFVVAVYAGNDFLEAARYLEYREGLEHSQEYVPRLTEAVGVHEGAVWQGFNQIAYFKSAPKMKGRVLQLAQTTLREIRGLCRKDGAELLVILLPTKLEMEWDSDSERLGRLKALLGFSDDDLKLNAALRQDLSRALRQDGISVLDAADAPLPAKGPPLFWNMDYHLSVVGHRWLAGLLAKELSQRHDRPDAVDTHEP